MVLAPVLQYSRLISEALSLVLESTAFLVGLISVLDKDDSGFSLLQQYVTSAMQHLLRRLRQRLAQRHLESTEVSWMLSGLDFVSSPQSPGPDSLVAYNNLWDSPRIDFRTTTFFLYLCISIDMLITHNYM